MRDAARCFMRRDECGLKNWWQPHEVLFRYAPRTLVHARAKPCWQPHEDTRLQRLQRLQRSPLTSALVRCGALGLTALRRPPRLCLFSP
jgi:hypothetical protein